MPRPLLSCSICRRRKVRCGREQPSCTNCLRLKEPCAYEADPYRRSHSRRADSLVPEPDQQPETEPKSPVVDSVVPDPMFVSIEDPWSGWAASVEQDSAIDISFAALAPEWPSFPHQFENESLPTVADQLHPLLEQPSLMSSHSNTESVQWQSHDLVPTANGFRESFTDRGSVQSSRRFPGFLSTESEGRHRYIGDAFWALIKGHGPVLDTKIKNRLSFFSKSFGSDIDTTRLTEISKGLGPKTECDAFLFHFIIGVRSIYPLIHVPTFRAQYERFWQWHQDMSDSPFEDPTFLCLLAAVLYCGATTATSSAWQSTPLARCQKDGVIERLRNILSSSLDTCKYQESPTLHTLVASLLAHSCTNEAIGPFSCLTFVSMVSRNAMSMGLHLGGTSFGLDPVTIEIGRRVWWHIVSLDAQATILNGSQTTLSGSAVRDDVPMVSDLLDEYIGGSPSGDWAAPPQGGSSVVMLLAIGHFETTRFKHSLIGELHSKNGIDQGHYQRFANELACLHKKFDSLISRIPAQGIPERGLLPSRLINSSPLHDKASYTDSFSEPTILASWASTMLTMLKAEATILFQKSFIGHVPVKGTNGLDMWESITNTCIMYLRNVLQIIQIPAFSPWAWYFTTHYAPLQCIYIALIYLERHPEKETASLARFYADEVIEVFTSTEEELSCSGPGHGGYAFTGRMSKQMIPAWRMIVLLRAKIKVSEGSQSVLGSQPSSELPAFLTSSSSQPRDAFDFM